MLFPKGCLKQYFEHKEVIANAPKWLVFSIHMNENMSKFNQINSLCYWLSVNTNYDCTALFDSNEDLFSVTIKKGNRTVFSYSITSFEKKGEKIIAFELSSIINNLLHLKDSHSNQR